MTPAEAIMPMTLSNQLLPAEVMAKAFYGALPSGVYPAMNVMVDAMRAAIRALAEMEPTIAMKAAGTVSEEQMYGIVRNEWALPLEVTDECKAYILAAAVEGEDLGRDVLPSSTGREC